MAQSLCTSAFEPCHVNRLIVFENFFVEICYFFIIKAETAKNYSWKEICDNKLYDTLVVQRKMMKDRSIKITGTGFEVNPKVWTD